ncbi:poliovirus receptor-related protein 4 [Stegastes partitus]|uniref:Poliovirus receptor-related protein 4 n=1 Tax=Stegastes partitus TaxID=144197 RepID=A0A9Y4KN36_9TELE|nr:PREDICTED: poliovirus receptor-related protein 4 [Stegastes partitus]
MESKGRQAKILALLFLIVLSVQGDFVEPPEPDTSLVFPAEGQTRLPCHYQEEEGERVVQVTWYKELPDGSKDQIITGHFTDGHTEFGRYSGRVRFESSSPTLNSALLIPNTEESDEGSYTCHISTFPNGNFERHITLTVWILPISSLDPVILVEGQSYRVVASCRAVGRPVPRLSWDTDLPGQHQDRTSEGGSVSSYYSLHPLRSMNGKKLDCLVSHPSLEQPRRISNRLVVQYPPDASITPSSGQWYAGLEKAELSCEGGGYPKPHNISWTWKGGALPDGVSTVGEKLVFRRALRMNDSGVYECVAQNIVGVGRTEYMLTVAATSQRKSDFPPDNLLLIIIGASAGALVLLLVIVVLLVNRHHRHRNKKLEMALNEKSDEIKTLSRQASFRRVNSLSTDFRLQGDDYALLRVDSRMKNSQMSLERPIYRGSQSTLVGKWGPPGEVEVDELGRPVVWHDGMSLRRSEVDGEKEERRRRVESYLKNSNMSLDSGLPSSLVPLKAQQDDGIGPRETDLGHAREGDSPRGEGWTPPQTVAEGQEEEDDDSSSSHQISEALNAHFYYSDGVLRPRPHSNAILLHPRAQII